MSDTLASTEHVTAPVSTGTVRDFVDLMKPRVMSLVVLTAVTGLVATPGTLHPLLGFIAIVCIAVGAGASGALNMWYDADIDAKMQRTAARPIPRGRVTAEDALAFGTVLSLFSVLSLGVLINWMAGALLALTIAFYVFVYTMWLKRLTPQNIVIGGAAGAFPPMVGAASVTGTLTLDSFILFLIIFLWTPPHFWALALYRSRDYARVGVPMLPVVAGPDETRRQIWIYSWLFVGSSLLPCLTHLGGWAYGATAVGFGVWFLLLAYRVCKTTEGRAGDAAAKRLFGISILHLFALFVVLLAEHTVTWLVR